MPWPLDPVAAALLRRDHTISARLLASVNGSAFVVPVPLLPGGSVQIDAGSAVRRTLSCEVVMPIDHPAVDALAAEIRAEYAVVSPSGVHYWTPVGTFVLTEVVETAFGRVRLTGADRWHRVNEAGLEQPVTTSGDTIAAITALLSDADPRITVDATGAPAGSHGSSLWDGERSDAVKTLAQSIGAVVYFDAEGVARIRPVPTLGDAIAWQVGRGAGKVAGARGLSRAQTYNAVVVKGSPQGAAPVYAVARVAAGPLRWGGPFGKKPRKFDTSLVSTPEQAQTMADAMLERVQGVARTLELSTLPNPALDAGDVLHVEVQPAVWQRHMYRTGTLPLGLGTTPISTRAEATDDV